MNIFIFARTNACLTFQLNTHQATKTIYEDKEVLKNEGEANNQVRVKAIFELLFDFRITTHHTLDATKRYV